MVGFSVNGTENLNIHDIHVQMNTFACVLLWRLPREITHQFQHGIWRQGFSTHQEVLHKYRNRQASEHT